MPQICTGYEPQLSQDGLERTFKDCGAEDGVMDSDEFSMWVASIFTGLSTEEFMVGITDFEKKTESVRAFQAQSGAAESMENLRVKVDSLFDRLDMDKSGKIDRSELIMFHGGKSFTNPLCAP